MTTHDRPSQFPRPRMQEIGKSPAPETHASATYDEMAQELRELRKELDGYRRALVAHHDISTDAYPMRWRREARGGYGYVQIIPCRVIREGRSRVKIAALRADGTEVERWVAYTSLRAPS